MPKRNLLTEHLQSVNESYFEHAGHALGFGVRMIVSGFCCLLHGLFPFLFVKTGSNCIAELHDKMVENRHKLSRHYQKSNTV